MVLLLTRQSSVRPSLSLEEAQEKTWGRLLLGIKPKLLQTSRRLWWTSFVVPIFRWERHSSSVAGGAFQWIGRWIRPMTSPTRSDRSPSGTNSRKRSSRQLLWIAAPSRGHERSQGIWALRALYVRNSRNRDTRAIADYTETPRPCPFKAFSLAKCCSSSTSSHPHWKRRRPPPKRVEVLTGVSEEQ